MGYIPRFQGCSLPCLNKPTVQVISVFSHPTSILPIQNLTIWCVYRSNGIHNGSQGSQAGGSKQIYNNPPVLDDWLVRATSHQTSLHLTYTLGTICQELGLIVNMEKSELQAKQIFDFLFYQFDLKNGKVRATQKCSQTLNFENSDTSH